ncbi:MAG: hypothetical protein IKC52_06330 [Clostridia bacterium]|nr:hypothetical protein [Clostridia bacterium]MBR2967062.1 hypothetical protein [Clostridia bacterium]
MPKNQLSYFSECVNNLIDGKLILVDKHIAELLKCVAQTDQLRLCLAETLKTSSYVTEFTRASVSWTKSDGTRACKLKLPAERNRLFAFVVCLLTEVDSGRRNFLEFLRQYFPDADSNESYARFANDVLKPFKRAGEHILKSVDPESLNKDWQKRAERFFASEPVYISTQTLKRLLALTEQVRLEFEQGTGLDEVERADVINVCVYFIHALNLKNPKILRLAWYALRNTLQSYPLVQEQMQAISTLLQDVDMWATN